jgi:hypothetical protein
LPSSERDSAPAKEVGDFEIAIHRFPYPRTYYDTDNNGSIDLIMSDIDGEGRTDSVLGRVGNGWEPRTPSKGSALDWSLFDDLPGRIKLKPDSPE